MFGRGSIAMGLAATVTLVSLVGCTLRIGETDVFRPPSLEAREDIALRKESELVAEFGATVSHETREFGGIPIALTRAAPQGLAPDAPLLVSCSGNASDRYSTGTTYAAKLLPFGEAVLFDYPGYGDSGGEATVADIEAMADDFIAWVEAEAGERPLVFWGHSLGGFVCSDLAKRSQSVDMVVLETTARNVSEVAKAWKPWWAPVRLRTDEDLARFDTADALADFMGPVVVIGAKHDEVLPVELHRSLARALPSPFASYIEIADANHFSAGFSPKAVAKIEASLAALERAGKS